MAVKTKAKKKKIVYEIDGLQFATKPLFEFYQELKEFKKQKLIKSFTLPTIQEQKAKSKYGAKKCEIDGNVFDSIMESRFYVYLRQEQEKGNVKKIELQPKFVLQEGFRKNGKAIRAINYISDFLVTYKDDRVVVYDVKGRETDDFKIKKKLFDYKYRDLTLICVQYLARTKQWVDIHAKKKSKTKKGAKASK